MVFVDAIHRSARRIPARIGVAVPGWLVGWSLAGHWMLAVALALAPPKTHHHQRPQ